MKNEQLAVQNIPGFVYLFLALSLVVDTLTLYAMI